MIQKTAVSISTEGITVNFADFSVFFHFLHDKEA
jgi:hypothetical protein